MNVTKPTLLPKVCPECRAKITKWTHTCAMLNNVISLKAYKIKRGLSV